VVIAKADFATKTRELSLAVTGGALIRVRVQNLARCLMFKLIVFAKEAFAEAALENSSSEIPYAALAFGANNVR